MSRNVTIIVIILIIILLAAYLVWLRGRYTTSIEKPIQTTAPTATVEPSISPTPTASASATPANNEATKSSKQKTATPSAKVKN